MKRVSILCAATLLVAGTAVADRAADEKAVKRAALDYIESQHVPNEAQMGRALHPDLRKRTYWHKVSDEEYVLETSRETMLWVAENYNKAGDAFPAAPRKDLEVLAMDGRIASVKLTADEWIDYMHLMKSDDGRWQVINVLWQYHDQSRHKDKQKK